MQGGFGPPYPHSLPVPSATPAPPPRPCGPKWARNGPPSHWGMGAGGNPDPPPMHGGVSVVWARNTPMQKPRGDIEETLPELVQIRGSESIGKYELEEIELECREAMGDSSVLGVFQSPYIRKLSFVGMVIMMLQQLCGMNAFMYYGVVIFQALGQPATVFNAGIGLVNVISTLPGV